MRRRNIPFYLTGGTALGRGYFNHRYSDDLDLFMNQCRDYSRHIETLFAGLEQGHHAGEFRIDYQRIQKYEDYTQVFLEQEDVTLKIDLVNDVAAHYGGVIEHPALGMMDSWRNIASNKLAALFRFEIKDIVDIRELARHYAFDWMSLIEEAKTKEAAVDPIIICNILKSVPPHLLDAIKWVNPIDPIAFKDDVNRIAEDILRGDKNTVFEEDREV